MYKYFNLFIIVLFVACNSSKDLINVQKIKNLDEYNQTGIIYNLPKSKIFVVVEVNKIVENKGPYSEFTQKYLGSLKNTVSENKTTFQIADISFHTVPIPDTSCIFVINSNENGLLYGIHQSEEGFLYSINMPEIDPINFDFDVFGNSNNKKDSEKLTFNNLTSEKNYKVVYDTIYREEVYDTIIRKIPILKKNVILKTPEEQAKDLADQILLLRDDRAALLVGEGDSDFLPEGEALKLMLDGLDKLEKEYLSMFMGKIDTIKHTYTFSYIPGNNDFYKKIVLFKFSQKSGVLPADNLYGIPVYLELKADEYIQIVKKYQHTQFLYEKVEKVENKAGLYYRIPQKALFSILFNSQIIAQKAYMVPQLGTIEALPAETFKKDVKIEFYSNLGSIKKIEVD